MSRGNLKRAEKIEERNNIRDDDDHDDRWIRMQMIRKMYNKTIH